MTDMDMDMDMKKLLNALDNNKHEKILSETTKQIEESKEKILLNLQLSKSKHNEIMKKLKLYQFVDELPDMKYGSYVRWINISNAERLHLTNGGIVCEIKVGEKGIIIVCRNNMNRFFQFNMNEALIFRKMSNHELILLSALDYISEST